MQEGRVALLALRAQICPKYDDGGGERRWRHQDFGCYRVKLVGPAPRVECRVHGVVVSRVPWAEPGSRFTRDFELECTWLMTVANRNVFCQVGVGRFGVSFSPCERRVSGRFGVGRSCWLLVIALVIA